VDVGSLVMDDSDQSSQDGLSATNGGRVSGHFDRRPTDRGCPGGVVDQGSQMNCSIQAHVLHGEATSVFRFVHDVRGTRRWRSPSFTFRYPGVTAREFSPCKPFLTTADLKFCCPFSEWPTNRPLNDRATTKGGPKSVMFVIWAGQCSFISFVAVADCGFSDIAPPTCSPLLLVSSRGCLGFSNVIGDQVLRSIHLHMSARPRNHCARRAQVR